MVCVVARFNGERGGRAPATWGQLGIWAKHQLDPSSNLDIFSKIALDSDTITVPAAVAAITQVIERHEMLRTRVRFVDGMLSQVVERSGTLTIPVVASRAGTLDADADIALASLREARVDVSAEYPLRVLLLTVADRVKCVAMVISHMAADAVAAQIVMADIRSAMTGELCLKPPAPQPTEVALEEHDAGGKQTERTARYWAELYRRMPPTMFDRVRPAPEAVSDSVPDAGRGHAVLVSPALDGAVRAMARRANVTTSTVLLAATTKLIGDWTGHQTSAVNLVVHNRFRSSLRGVVGNMVQTGLFVLDTGQDMTFADIVRRASGRSLHAYRHAYYDQAAIESVREGIRRERGMDVNPYCCFNDLREILGDSVDAKEPDAPDAPGAPGVPDAPGVAGRWSEEKARFLLPRTSLEWIPDPSPSRCRFCLQVRPSRGSVCLSLSADTGYLPLTGIERFLRAMESLIVTSALNDTRGPAQG
jgi:hypothetical protein